MSRLRDRLRDVANNIVKTMQELVYGEVRVYEDVRFLTYTLCIIDRDFKYKCDITEWMYKIENDYDMHNCIEYILDDYMRMILGKYIVYNIGR